MKKMSLRNTITMILIILTVCFFTKISWSARTTTGTHQGATNKITPKYACHEDPIHCTPTAVILEADNLRIKGKRVTFGHVLISNPSGVTGSRKIHIKGETGSIDLDGSINTKAGINTKGDLKITNPKGRIITPTITITGGLDIAEPFDISNRSAIKPGMVVSIHTQQLGKLRIADRAYDRTVAGIVSGANGINPGMTMSQEGIVPEGLLPVALTGRVYAWADASNGPIVPGDLLTTSDTPGHAMKVTDYEKAQGAVLGKAMTSLDQGRGLVLVLVTLQ